MAFNCRSIVETQIFFFLLHEKRMHSSRMRTVHCSGRLSCHACPLATHLPVCMRPTMYAPLPHMPPAMHAPGHAHPHHTCPPSLCTPPFATLIRVDCEDRILQWFAFEFTLLHRKFRNYQLINLQKFVTT